MDWAFILLLVQCRLDEKPKDLKAAAEQTRRAWAGGSTQTGGFIFAFRKVLAFHFRLSPCQCGKGGGTGNIARFFYPLRNRAAIFKWKMRKSTYSRYYYDIILL